MIRPVTLADAAQIARIYNHYVDKTVITFEEDAVSAEEMGSRISRIADSYPWLVADKRGAVAGYAYASLFDGRCAYRTSVETTVYVSTAHVGRGLGTELYAALIDELRIREMHCAIGRIALPNEASIALHERLGFVKVGQLKEIGRKFDRWVDVGYWELLL